MNKVAILPLDGIENGRQLIATLSELMSEPGMPELVAYVKLNDGLHNFDMGGPRIIHEITSMGTQNGANFGIFIDLKIFDVSATLTNVLKKYLGVLDGAILTVSAGCSIGGFIALRHLLPRTQLALVSVPTDISDFECMQRFNSNADVKIATDALNIERLYKKKAPTELNANPFDLIVCSAQDLPHLKKNLPDHYGFITPGIRDEWMKKADEHKKRVTGVVEALERGASFVVMGAQLTKGNPDQGISAEESRRLTIQALSAYFSE